MSFAQTLRFGLAAPGLAFLEIEPAAARESEHGAKSDEACPYATRHTL